MRALTPARPRRAALLCAIGAAALTATACERQDGMAANGKICASFKTGAAPGSAPPPGAAPVAADAATPVDDCVKRWAYTLAASRDAAEEVADAAVAACAAPLSTWNQSAVAQTPGTGGVTAGAYGSAGEPPMGAAGQGPGESQAVDLVTGQPVGPMAEHANFARNRALLYVVQARAGHCRPPGVVNGQPTGT